MQEDHNNNAGVSSTLLLLLTSSTIASYSPVSYLGSASMAMSSTGLSSTCYLAPSVLDVITLSHRSIHAHVASPSLRSWSSAFRHEHYPLSTLVSSLSLNHHLYAYDSQLFFFTFYPPNFDSGITHLQNALQQSSSWMTVNLLTLNSFNIEFLLIGLKKQLDKTQNSLLNTTNSARNLGFDEHLTFSDQISAISKACYYHIRQLRCMCHITPVWRSLHWFKITERIEYELLSLTYKVVTTNQPPYLHHFISVQPRSTRSSSLVTHAKLRTSSWLRITDRSFRYASPCLWNQLPSSLRQLHFSPSVSDLPVHAPITSSHSVNSPHSPSKTPSLFRSRLKTYLFHKSFPP